MKKILSLLCLFLSFFSVFGQVRIKGIIVDGGNGNEPLSYVSIALKQGERVVKGVMSNDDGEFLIENVSNGTYTLVSSFMGYKNTEKTFSISGKNKAVDLGNIVMNEDSKILQEVEVVAQGSQGHFEIDKKVFSVDQSIAAAGGDATEVLQGIPSVEVDNDGGISLRNNSNVEIWINGKPSGLTDDNKGQVLEQLPAENIESIELITNPSAKFSPEGSAGVINIVLKKNRKPGYYGSVNAGLSHLMRSDRVGERGGANVTWNVGRWDGTADVGVRNDYRGSETEVDRKYKNSSGDISSVLDQDTWQRTRRTALTGAASLNYRINSSNTIGASGRFMMRDQGYESKMDYLLRDPLSNSTLRQYNRDIDGKREPLFARGLIDHSWTIDKHGSSLQSSVMYSHFGETKDYRYVQDGDRTLDQKQITDDENSTVEFKSDLDMKVRKHSIGAGVNVRYQDRYSLSEVKNSDGSSYVNDPDLYNKYKYKEQLYAAYVTFGSRIRNFSYQLGLRGEYLVVDNSSNGIASPRKSYFQPFPTVFLSYALPKDNEIQLNYTRRVNRPRGKRLNSYHDISDSTNITFGNPDLDPEFVNAFEFNHIKTWEKHTFSSSLYYHYTQDVIRSFSFMDMDNVLNTTYMNTTNEHQAGVEFVLKDSWTKWFNLTTTLNLFYERIETADFSLPASLQANPISGVIHIPGDEAFSWSAKMIGNFMFTKTFTGQLTAAYRSSGIVTQGKSEGFFTLDAGLKKTFLSKRIVLAFSVRDILNSRRNETTTETEDFKQYSKRIPFGPNFRLTCTYNFGNTKSKKNRKGKSDSYERDDDSSNDIVDEF